MVHLDLDNDHILLEGYEYPNFPIDFRPKFHLYRSNIVLISGIYLGSHQCLPT
ncbi:MAG: hypothetical protein ACMUEM_03875 [Flavobacteriales bacterium AspAUS03]